MWEFLQHINVLHFKVWNVSALNNSFIIQKVIKTTHWLFNMSDHILGIDYPMGLSSCLLLIVFLENA